MRRFFCVLTVCVALCVWCAQALYAQAPAALAMQKTPQGKWICVQTHQKRLTLYEGTQVLKTYTIATGTQKTPTPLGVFRIVGRFRSDLSGFGTRFLRLNVPWGQYGIHGTNNPASIGTNASHGCVRMRVRDAEELYALVPNGTLVLIEGGAYGALDDALKTLSPGERSSHVYLVQQRLARLGFYAGTPDGIYGENTSRAVLKARKNYALTPIDTVDAALYQHLGLMLFE